jgi:hypothetical protein
MPSSRTINPIAVPKNLEDLLKLDSIKCLSDVLENHTTPAAKEPPTAAPGIGTRSKSAAPGLNAEAESPHADEEGDQESKQDPTTIPWKSDFTPRQACLRPPTMFDIVVDIPTDPMKLFLALRTRVESLTFGTKNNHDDDANSINSNSSDASANLSAHELATYTYTLQYAFCLAHGYLEGASVEPCTSGPHDRRLKELTRLRLDLTDPLNPGTPAGDQPAKITNPASIDFTGLQSSLDRLATSSSSKKPGFDRLSPQKRNMLLLLSSSDMISPALHITNDLRELLSQRNNAEATEWMQTHLVNSYRVDANLTGLATAAIYAMHLSWERSDMPSNFTPFYLYRQSASDFGDNTDASENLAASLKALSGAPPDIEAKKMTAAKMMRPNTPDEALYMLRNFYRISCMIWGKTTRIPTSILDVTNHLTSNHLIYDQVTQTDPNFPTKVVFIADQAIQQVIRSALNAKSKQDSSTASCQKHFTTRSDPAHRHQHHQEKILKTNNNRKRNKESQTTMTSQRNGRK